MVDVDLPNGAVTPVLGIDTKDWLSYTTGTWQPCSSLFYSKESGNRNNIHVNQLMNG